VPVLATIAAPAPAQQADSVLSRAMAYAAVAAEEHRREEGTPGIVLALLTREGGLETRAMGVADLGTGALLTDSTRLLAGSISKAFTAVALLQLQEEGLVVLHQPVVNYLPWFKVRSRFAPITLHHLLTHSAGLPRDRSDLPSSPYTALALRDRELGAAPGERFAYSNIGYQLLSLVAEEVEGRPFAEIIRSRVLAPLGLRRTSPAVTPEGRLTAATGYQYLFDDRPPTASQPLVPVSWGEGTAGDANIVTTARDLAIFLRALLNQGQGPAARLLQPASFARMVQRTVPATELGEGSFYGYGVILGAADGNPVLWHSGGMPGFRTMMLGDLDEGLGVVVLMNGPGNPRRLAEYALRVLIAGRRGRPLPPVPVTAPAELVPDAGAYAGQYRDSAGRTVVVAAEGERLFLSTPRARAPLLRSGPDAFLTPHPDFGLFPVRFGRQDGAVVELMHGGAWYVGEAYRGPLRFPHPGGWAAYPGHYRAQVPYYSNYRVVLRKGALLLVSPEGYEEPLRPLGGQEFRVGADEHTVERVRFTDVVSGRALRMNFSGTDYYRTTSP
jgi:CubicO group peptidase (beta-lactamase class C family)